MKAEKIFVKIEDLKREFYHKYPHQQFGLEHYQTVAAAITTWLADHQPDAAGGFWTGEMNPPGELTEITELGILCFAESDR
jgi:hypothetical protein